MNAEILIGILISGLIGAAIGQARGRAAAGLLWGLILGPLGWLITLLGPNYRKMEDDKARRQQDIKMQRIQEAHLSELRALRASIVPTETKPAIQEDSYFVRIKDREIGPIDRLEMIELYTSGKITLDTRVALDTDSAEKVYRELGDEVPALKRT
jgi:hypothetical protein